MSSLPEIEEWSVPPGYFAKLATRRVASLSTDKAAALDEVQSMSFGFHGNGESAE